MTSFGSVVPALLRFTPANRRASQTQTPGPIVQLLTLGDNVVLAEHAVLDHESQISSPSPPSAVQSENAGVEISPRVPERFERYKRDAAMQTVPKKASSYQIRALEFYRPENSSGLPSGWVSKTHPEGARYFYKPSEELYTDADIRETRICELIEKVVSFVNELHPELIRLVDIAVDKITENPDGTFSLYYYLADHKTQTVFWLQDFEFHPNFPASCYIKGATDRTHIRHEIEAQYWYHCSLFPTAISRNTVDELLDTLLFSISELLLASPTTTVSYSTPELERMLDLVKNIQLSFKTSDSITFPGSASALSRLMHIFARHKFVHFYGQPSARLEGNISVHGSLEYSKFLACISLFFFFSPIRYYHSLRRFWIDGLVRHAPWTDFVEKTITSCLQYLGASTLLLTANFGFLSIQSVDHSNDTLPLNKAQIAAYFSIVFSLVSVVTSLYLWNQHQKPAYKHTAEVAAFMHAHNLELLAIMYSLPYSSMLWGAICFVLAITLYTVFDHADHVTAITLGTVLCVMVSLIGAVVFVFSWEKESYPSWLTANFRETGNNLRNRFWQRIDDFAKTYRLYFPVVRLVPPTPTPGQIV